MGILTDILNLADDIISIPTDILGITNHYNKKQAIQTANEALITGKIDPQEYAKLINYINKNF
jgi:hypothetical protein